MRFDESSNITFDQWQNDWRKKLRTLLEPWPARQVAPDPQWQLLESRDKYDLHEVTYTVEPGLEAFALVALPKGVSPPMAGVVAIHGHGSLGATALFDWQTPQKHASEVRKHRYDYGHRLAERGMVVWAPNLRGFGRRLTTAQQNKAAHGRDMCDMTFWQQQALGQTALTGQIHELMIAVDLLASLEQVDEKRIGCAGLSYGGRTAMYLAALDARISGAIVSGALNSFVGRIAAGGSCGYQIAPGLLNYGDVGDILGLIAPRPLAVELGLSDAVCPMEEAKGELDRVRAAYRAANADDRLNFITFEGGHAFHGDESIPWLQSQLG